MEPKHQVFVTDIDGLKAYGETGIEPNYDLVMAWLDTAEEPVYNFCDKHELEMASRIAGWKGIYRTCRVNPKIHFWVNGVVCCNQEIQLSAERIYPRNVVTIMNGVDSDTFKPREDLNIDGRWLWIGRQHDEQKDYNMLLQVQANYKRRIDVVGQRWSGGKVVPTDWPGEMVAKYQAARGFVRTSRNEGSSNCLLEAMSCGLPVVATPCGVAPRILHPKCLATSSVHIVRALREFDDAEYARAFGRMNRKTILDGWQWSMRREAYMEFFEKCVS